MHFLKSLKACNTPQLLPPSWNHVSAESLNYNRHISHTNNSCLWLNAICQINLCLTSLLLLILDPYVSLFLYFLPLFFFFFFPLPSRPLFCYLLLSPSLAPSTQMLPTAQLGRSDGMCHLGITTIPTSYTASRNMAGWERIFWEGFRLNMSKTEKYNKIQHRRWAATKTGFTSNVDSCWLLITV